MNLCYIEILKYLFHLATQASKVLPYIKTIIAYEIDSQNAVFYCPSAIELEWRRQLKNNHH